MTKDDSEAKKELERWVGPKPDKLAVDGSQKNRGYHYTPNSTQRMVAFVFPDHSQISLPYSRLASLRYDMSKGIELDFGRERIRVRGRDLSELYAGLRQFSVIAIVAPEVKDGFEQDEGDESVTDIELNPDD